MLTHNVVRFNLFSSSPTAPECIAMNKKVLVSDTNLMEFAGAVARRLEEQGVPLQELERMNTALDQMAMPSMRKSRRWANRRAWRP